MDYHSVGLYPADWDDKIWWVQAEGLYALAASARVHGKTSELGIFRTNGGLWKTRCMTGIASGMPYWIVQAMPYDCKGLSAPQGTVSCAAVPYNLCVLCTPVSAAVCRLLRFTELIW